MTENVDRIKRLRQTKTKKAMYKVVDDNLIIIAKDKNGMPIVIEKKI